MNDYIKNQQRSNNLADKIAHKSHKAATILKMLLFEKETITKPSTVLEEELSEGR